jgi:hypothetical protein
MNEDSRRNSMAKRGIQLTLGIGTGTVALLAMLALLALSIGSAHPALAAGCNVPSGSYPTIQSAVDDANCSPIVVAAGTYNENIVIIRSLTLRGAGAASTIINGGRAGVVISIGKGAAPVIQGFTITGGDGSSNNGEGGGISIREATAVIRNNVISDNVASQVVATRGVGGGISVISSTNPVRIYNNVIQANLAYSVSLASPTGAQYGVGGGIMINDASSAVITGNQILSNVSVRTNIPGDAWGGGGGLGASGDDVTVDGNTIQGNIGNEVGGDGGGGGIALWGTVATLTNNSIVQNTAAVAGAYADGGGIRTQNVPTLTLTGNWVMSNTAMVNASPSAMAPDTYVGGGGLRITGYSTLNESLTLNNNHIIGNVAVQTMSASGTDQGNADGGGLSIGSITTMLITGNEVRENTVVVDLSLSGSPPGDTWGGRPSGGGIYISDSDSVTLRDNEIQDNVTAEQQVVNNVDSGSEGGGISLINVENATASNNTISDNVAVVTGSITSNAGRNYFSSGGGIMVGCWNKPSCTLSFTGNDISDNIAAYTIIVSGSDASGGANGGGLNASQVSDISLSGNTISDNRAMVSGSASGSNQINAGGGGASFDSSTALLQSNVVRGNIGHLAGSDGFGGGVNFGESTATMEGNLILSNRSTQGGQGAPATWVWRGTLTSTNDVFAHNTGGVGSGTDGPPARMTIINDTFYDNGDRGIEVNDVASTVYVTNTIVFSHEHGLRLNNPASTLSGDYNLLSNSVNYAGGATGGPNDILNQDPLFVNAAADDLHLSSDSPAIDEGDNAVAPAVDFEGDPRPYDGDSDGTARVDIGADEYRIRDFYLPMILKNASH